MFHIVLLNPQIPQNTGNIVRTCSVTGASLHLIKPFAFELSDKKIRRAGLDYWDEVNINTWDSWQEFKEQATEPLFFFTSKTTRKYTQVPFTQNAYLIFGSETSGFPEIIYTSHKEDLYTIPMQHNKRCLNLSNAVAIVLYEGWRQLNFF